MNVTPEVAPPPSSAFQVDFLTKIQRLLTEGDFTASYKFALFHALADLAVELGTDTGEPLNVSTDAIAEKFILYYWRQARPYAPPLGGLDQVLVQNTSGQAEVLRVVVRAHEQFAGSFVEFRRATKAYASAQKKVRTKIEEQPLPRLQRVGGEELRFLYDLPHPGEHAVTLKEGIAYCFRQFHELVLDLVQAAWIRWLRGLSANQQILGQVSDLSEWMFGAERASLQVYRPILLELQKGACFYCHGSLKGEGAVDHFIPWSRYQVDLGHNFVLAHSACNSAKSDMLAAVLHLENWWERNEIHNLILVSELDNQRLMHNLECSKTVALWAYLQAARTQSLLWERGKTLVPVDQSGLSQLVRQVSNA